MKRYNLTVPREAKNGKTYWDPVGVMFKRDKGGYSIRLSMFPELNIMAFPVEDKQPEPAAAEEERFLEPVGDGATPDDDIPF